MMIDENNTALVVIDVQGKLTHLVYEHEKVLLHVQHLIRACEKFAIPILWTEQAPEKIGETIESVKDLLFPMIKPIRKMSFSCYGSSEFVTHLNIINRKHIVLIGIETHVCVYQTAIDLNRHGYHVHVVADAVSSRQQIDHDSAIESMRREGVSITTTEMLMCALLKTALHPKFKEIMAFIKR